MPIDSALDAAARLSAGHCLTAADLGALAALGAADVLCARRPTVAVFTFGDALRPPGQPLQAGERHDACRALLFALLQEAELEPVAWPILPSDPLLAASALADAAQAFDLVVVCCETDAVGCPLLAALLGLESAPHRLAMTLGASHFHAAPIGSRAPRALCLVLPEDRAAISQAWTSTGAALIDAMQGKNTATPLQIDATEAWARRAAGARLIDVRETDEQVLGMVGGAVALPLSLIERDCARVPEGSGPLLLLCASGKRSLRAAALLRERGVADACSVSGGLPAWRAVAEVGELLDADALERYDRHLRLAAVGPDGQKRLLGARVVIVGAGGLGSPAAFYLAASGVGHLVLIDDDCVERSNLQRQILHTDDDVGVAKVISARKRLLALNPRIHIDAIEARLGPDNVEALLRGTDVVIDGSDNFATRYLVDAACRQLGLPLVYGAVERFTGQVSVFDAGRQPGRAPCYRCLFPEPPGVDAAPNCAEAGVLGVLPGLIGLLQATEALKLILGIGTPLIGRLLMVDALAMRFRTLELPVDTECPGCGLR